MNGQMGMGGMAPQQDVAEQIAAIKAKCTTFASTNVRQVQGGFLVAGQVQYMDRETKGMMLSESAEAVASSPDQVAQMTANYLRTGNFDGTVAADTQQANLFAATPATI